MGQKQKGATGGGNKPKSGGLSVAKAGVVVAALVLMVVGGTIGINFLGTPGSQDERSQAMCEEEQTSVCSPYSDLAVPYCVGNQIYTHQCKSNNCWTPGVAGENCADNNQICANGQCVDPGGEGNPQNCEGTIEASGNGLSFHTTDCNGYPWSVTAYICNNDRCGNDPELGVCHKDCNDGAPVLGTGDVDAYTWDKFVTMSDDDVRCKLVQIDGAVGNPNAINGWNIINNLNSDDPACAEATPTPTPPLSCNSACTGTGQGNCPSGLVCTSGFCRNTSCTSETDCICPGVTPSVTPTPIVELACEEIGVSKTAPTIGDTINLTCSGTNSSGNDTYEYRYQFNNGAAWPTLAPKADKSADLMISQVGTYNVECRVCRLSASGAGAPICTEWQSAE